MFKINTSVSLIIVAGVILSLAGMNRLSAQSITPKSTVTEGVEQVEDLKDRLATKVAELAVSEPRAFYGSVKSVNLTSLVLETLNKTLKIELTDDITAYRLGGTKRMTIKTDDLKPQTQISVIGQYDTTLELLKAKVIYVEPELPFTVAGKIENINQKGFSFQLTSPTGAGFTVDYEKSTQATLNNLKNDPVKVGFSKIPADRLAIVTGFRNEDDEQRISADRIFILDREEPNISPATTASPSADND